MNTKKTIILLLISYNMIFCVDRKKENDSMNNKVINSIGKTSLSNKRIGEWKYYDDTGKIIAQGEYLNGLKEGIWNYSSIKYNGKKRIDWVIKKNKFFILNIPKDWNIGEDTSLNIPMTFNFHDIIRNVAANANITLIEKKKDRSIELSVDELLKENKINTQKFELLTKERVIINSLESYYLQQHLTNNNIDIVLEQFVIYGEDTIFLLSFFVRPKDLKLFHSLFAEIAYSFTEK